MTFHREQIEWCNVWIRDAGEPARPRILFIGDSIVQGYYPVAEEALAETAATARLTTSRFLTDPIFNAELALVLPQYHWTVIHVNNGLHGWDYSEDEYARGLPRLIEHLRAWAPYARIIWGQSTPKRIPGQADFAPDNARVLARNALAREAMTALGVPVNDQYALVAPHPEFWSPDGVHFTTDGSRTLGLQAVACVQEQW